MKITIQHVTNLLSLLTRGLINGAGETKNEFCIQQAIHRVLDDDLDGQHSDAPPVTCISGRINNFGICMNDQEGWIDEKDRANGLRRFAIAELGSAKVSYSDFVFGLQERVRGLVKLEDFEFNDGDNENLVAQFMEFRPAHASRSSWLKKLANMAANTLRELGTEGSRFLWMVDEPDKAKRQEAAYRLGDKIFAAQLADAGSDCSFGLPPRRHHH